MSECPLHDVAIVGAYNTRQARRLADTTELEILMDAVRGALDDSGLGMDAVDGCNITGSTSGLHSRQGVTLLGGRPSWTGLEYGIGAVLEAAAAIATGQCETVVIATAQVGEYVDRSATAPWTRPSNEFVAAFGLYTAAEFALIARRHMHLYGTRSESLAEVASTIRRHGGLNPEAVMTGRFPSSEDVLASRMVADPFHLLDCCITSEGGAGLVLTRAERARDLDATPVYLLGGATERRGMSYVAAPVWDHTGWVGERAAQKSFEQCGLTPSAVDFAELYDPFSFEIIRQLEAFGFCEHGEGGDYVMNGRIGIKGDLPVATNGGILAYSHAGLAQLLQKPIAAVQQLRGEVPEALRVPDARVAMATNGGAGALFTDVLLLGKESI
jgi:acetyl-CoA acetyltransferase